MYILTSFLFKEADTARMVTALTRAQDVSFTRLATNAGVQKASLLKFCKGQDGGYLSTDALGRVLSVLGWEKGGLSTRRVHMWRLSDVEDAKFLLEIVLQGRALMSYLNLPAAVPRMAVGVWGDSPLMITVGYAELGPSVDPLLLNIAGSFASPDRLRPDSRELETASHSPKNFFRIFGQSTPAPPGAGEAEFHGIAQAFKILTDWGFTDKEVFAVVADFLTMKCRTEAEQMRSRLDQYLNGYNAKSSGQPVPDWLRSGLREEAEREVARLAQRTYQIWPEIIKDA